MTPIQAEQATDVFRVASMESPHARPPPMAGSATRHPSAVERPLRPPYSANCLFLVAPGRRVRLGPRSGPSLAEHPSSFERPQGEQMNYWMQGSKRCIQGSKRCIFKKAYTQIQRARLGGKSLDILGYAQEE